jgi:hypothetical protein
MTGHSLAAVWAQPYARSFGKAQRDEARDRLLSFGFGSADIALTQAGEDPTPAESETTEGPDVQALRKVGGTRHCANQALVSAEPLSVA